MDPNQTIGGPEAATDDVDDVDDVDLLRRTADGDRSAFGLLIRRHQRRVVALATRLLSSADRAEDVAQEAFLRVYCAAGTFEPRARFSTWLYRIVVNLCHDERRRWRFRFARLFGEPAARPGLAKVETDEIAARVRAAVDRLPDKQRTVLVLHRFEGLSCREAAEATGLSESSVESLLVRAYANLRKSLADLENPRRPQGSGG